MSRPTIYIHGTKYQNSPVVTDGTCVFCPPAMRLAANGDTSVTYPWGSPQTAPGPPARAAVQILSALPTDQRAIQIIGGLSRSCDRFFGSIALGEWHPSQADIVRGILSGCFACDQDVKLCSPGAKVFRDAGVIPHVVLFDAETYPQWINCFRARGVSDPDPTHPHEDYSDIWEIVHRATGCTQDQFTIMGQTALYNAACAVVNALGFSGADVVVNDIHLLRPDMANHFVSVDQIPTSTPIRKLYAQIDPSLTPDKFAAKLATAQSRGATGVFILSDMATQAQFDALAPVLRVSPATGV